MLVAFWSPAKGQGSVTSSILASASALAIDYQNEFMLLDTEGNVDLQKAYGQVFESTFMSQQDGFMSVKRLLDSGKLDDKSISRCATTVVEKRLDLMVTSDVSAEERHRLLKPTLIAAKKHYSATFVDFGSEDLSTTKQSLVDLVDLVVVCIPQNPKKLDGIKAKVSGLFAGKKIHYLVSRFEDSSALTVTKIATSLGTKHKEVSIIPRSVGLMDALGKDNIFDFFQRAVTAKKSLFKSSEEELCVRRIREFNEALISKLDLVLDKENN